MREGTSRRGFLAGLGALTLASAARLRAAGIGKVGVQLYTLRDVLPGDFEGTLEALAEIGFEELEFAGYYDRDPAAIRGTLDGLGLTAPATHADTRTLRAHLPGLIDAAKALGHEYVVCSYVHEEERRSLDQWVGIVEELAGWAETCAAAGLRMGYHNHAFEFETVEGKRPYDLIVAGTGSEQLRLELDLFWVHRAGLDPEAALRRYAGRVDMVHVKDSDAEGGFTEVGSGVIPWPGVLAAAREVGVRHFFVEQDRTSRPSLESVRMSYEYLRGLDF